ncbi:MAG: LPS export ABC transporter periplasmic protein LptC [Candidatus Eremiobacteraeota bacterium]|nr:LPS export ABC transporter periplasmic protein LptC [Candidatus Eremiobacteraeota bacterium]
MKKIRKTSICILFLAIIIIVLCICRSVPAQDSDVRLTADRLIYDEKAKKVTLEGNVRFLYKKTVLSGSLAYFNMKTRKGRIEGDVKIFQPGTTIVGDVMIVNYNENVAKLKGNVKLVTVRDLESSPGERSEMLPSGVTTITCDSLVYSWLTREGTASTDVAVEQKNRRAYADKAHYSGSSDLITMEGRVRFEEGSNNWVTCKKAYIDLKKETFMAVGGVTGNFLVQEDKKKEKTEKAQPSRPADKIILPDLPYSEKKLPE